MSSWQVLIGLSVVLYSINDLLHRTIMKDSGSDGHTQAIVFNTLSCVFLWVIFLIKGDFSAVPSVPLLALFLLAALVSSVGMVLTFKGFKLIGASEHTVLLTTTQLWTFAGAIVVLGERLTLTKGLGTFAILFGVVLAQRKKEAFVFNRGAIYVLLAALAFGASGIISYFIVSRFSVLGYMAYGSVIVAAILMVSRPSAIRGVRFYFKPKRALNVLLTSLNDVLANIFGLMAYQIGRNALQIGPIAATQTLVTILLAGIVLKERDRFTQKIMGGAAAVLGGVLLLM